MTAAWRRIDTGLAESLRQLEIGGCNWSEDRRELSVHMLGDRATTTL